MSWAQNPEIDALIDKARAETDVAKQNAIYKELQHKLVDDQSEIYMLASNERHAINTKLPRLAGWFGNDPDTRFRMHLEPEFIPVPSADGWQISNPPILSMAPLRASLAIFEEAGGMDSLRQKSIKQTNYLQFLLESEPDGQSKKQYTIITPRQADQRGCQLSILVREHPKELFAKLEAAGVKCDFREPNVIRVAPTPLYNTFHEVWRFANILRRSD